MVLRYWEDLQHTFDIDWNDARDKEDTVVEHIIQVSTLPAGTAKRSVEWGAWWLKNLSSREAVRKTILASLGGGGL